MFSNLGRTGAAGGVVLHPPPTSVRPRGSIVLSVAVVAGGCLRLRVFLFFACFRDSAGSVGGRACRVLRGYSSLGGDARGLRR